MIERTCRANLLAIAEAYARVEGLSLATVSRQFHGNQAFLGRLKSGKCSMTVPKLDEMVRSFISKWPKGARWPLTRAILFPRPGRKISVGKVRRR